MSLLQYTSEEMYSATDLVRKNKFIFDKLQKKEIEKAIILRDGKPSIILMDFIEYERVMKEFIELKSSALTNQKNSAPSIDGNRQKNIEIKSDEKISKDEYENALKEIEKISFESDFSEDFEEKIVSKPLKDFWEK